MRGLKTSCMLLLGVALGSGAELLKTIASALLQTKKGAAAPCSGVPEFSRKECMNICKCFPIKSATWT